MTRRGHRGGALAVKSPTLGDKEAGVEVTSGAVHPLAVHLLAVHLPAVHLPGGRTEGREVDIRFGVMWAGRAITEVSVVP